MSVCPLLDGPSHLNVDIRVDNEIMSKKTIPVALEPRNQNECEPNSQKRVHGMCDDQRRRDRGKRLKNPQPHPPLLRAVS